MDVILTQIQAPSPSRRFVQRPRIARLVRKGMDRKLVFIGAPPGYGKTALAAACVQTAASQGAKCAWMTLGRQDNAPLRFWNIVMSALRQCDRTMQFDVQLDSDNGPYDVIAAVVNQVLRKKGSRYLLVIDDYQYITAPALNEQVGSLVKHAPQNLTVVIVSDRAPTFPVAALRLDEQMVEISGDDLRFTSDESEYYLRDCCHLDLTPDEVKTVHRATRGWPAGLHMAQVALSDGRTAMEALEAVEGMRSSFFIDEVVSRQSAEVQEFLVQIAHLPRLSLPLAEYVTQNSYAGQLVAELAKKELFAETTQDDPPWYAFSKTFRKALRQRAAQELQPAQMQTLQLRTSMWFEEHGFATQAIEFALNAQDIHRAIRIMTTHLATVLAQSEGEVLLQQIEQMAWDDRVDPAQAKVLTAWAYCSAGRPRSALHWIDLARVAMIGGAPDSNAAVDEALRSLVLAATEARAYSLLGDFPRAIELGTEAFGALQRYSREDSQPWLELTVRHTLAESYPHVGDFARAFEHLEICFGTALVSGRPVVYFLSACELSELHQLFGRWEEAARVANEALRANRANLFDQPWSLALLHVQLALLHLERGDFDDAEDLLMRASRRITDRSNSDGCLSLSYAQAELAQARGMRARAAECYVRVLQIAQSNDVPRGKSRTLGPLCIVRLVALGEFATAAAYMESVLDNCDAGDPQSAALAEAASAAFALGNAVPDQAEMHAGKALDAARAYGMTTVAVEAGALLALACAAQKRPEEADLALLEAVREAQRANSEFLLVVSGVRMRALAEQALARRAGMSRAFQSEWAAEMDVLRHCLDLFPAQDAHPEAKPDSGLGLTGREQQVDELLRMGKTRREIADELGISYNTVRVHVSNIYKKAQSSGSG